MTCLLLKIAEIGTNKMQERERGETSNDTGVSRSAKISMIWLNLQSSDGTVGNASSLLMVASRHKRAAFTSLPCAGHRWRESLYPHQGCLKLLDCGRLGRQAAGHPWSALRVMKSCQKDCPTAEVLREPKQQLCIQSGTRAYHLNYLQRR